MARRVLLIGFIVMLTACQIAMAEMVDVSRWLDRSDPIKIYISAVTNESGQSQIAPEDFKKALESSIKNRRSMKFEIVSDPLASDFQIAAIIKKYSYSKTDPVNSIAGPSALILDAVTTENYAEMDVDFTITSSRDKTVVWKDNISDYVEHTMTPGESIPMVYDKVARRFLWKAFGKGK